MLLPNNEERTHVRRVEELDGVGSTLSTVAVTLDGDLDAESLEVDDESEDSDGRDEVHDVGKTFPVERLLEGATLVVPGEEEVEEGDEGSFELGSASGVDGRGGEGLPNDRFADVGRDEEVDARPEAVALLEELVEEDHDEGGDDELEDKEKADSGAEVGGKAVEASEDVDGSLAERDNHGEDCDGRSAVSSRSLLATPGLPRRVFLDADRSPTQLSTKNTTYASELHRRVPGPP